MSRVTQAEFARMAGVNRSTVSRWIQSGHIEADAAGLVDPVAASRMRSHTESQLPHHQAKKAALELEKAAAAAPTSIGSTDLPAMPDSAPEAVGAADITAFEQRQANDVNGRYKLAMALEREAKAELAAMEVDKLAGSLVERDEVDFVLADLGNTLRNAFESLPDRQAGPLAALRGDTNAIHKALTDTYRDVMASLAEQMKRRMDGVGK